MSDRIGVMSEGELLQIGTPEEIYEAPVNRFVADFIGETNFIEATVVAPGEVRLAGGDLVRARTHSEAGSEVTLTLRPEKIQMHSSADTAGPDSSTLKGTVERRVYYGDSLYYEVRVGPSLVDVKVENHPGMTRWQIGDRVVLEFHPEAAEALTG